MKRYTTTIIIAIIIFFGLLATAYSINANTVTKGEFKVVGVTDGDTLTALSDNNKQIKVRLYGIDSPEKSQPYYKVAKEYLAKLVFNKIVTIEILNKDRYGRSIGKIYLGELYVNGEMVRVGLAWWYEYYAKKDQDLKIYQASAKLGRKGIWSSSQEQTPPWEFRKSKRNH